MKTVAILSMLVVAAPLLWDCITKAQYEHEIHVEPKAFIVEALLICMLVLTISYLSTNWNP